MLTKYNMTISNFYYFKQPAFDFINKDFDFSKLEWPNIIWPRLWVRDNIHNILTPEAQKWFIDIGLPEGTINRSCRIFHTKPFSGSNIHNDGQRIGDGDIQFINTWSINYVWGNSKLSHMKWFEEIDTSRGPQWSGSKTVLGTTYQIYDQDNVRVTQTENYTQGLALLCVKKAHQIQNLDQGDRYCLSIRTHDERTWEEIVDFLRPHLQIPGENDGSLS